MLLKIKILNDIILISENKNIFIFWEKNKRREGEDYEKK